MSIKSNVSLTKLWLLLLLIGNTASARDVVIDTTCPGSKTLYQAERTYHKDGLQPQAPSMRIAAEHHAKNPGFGYIALPMEQRQVLLPLFAERTTILVQDTDRCESVSRLLFPHHYFW